MKLHIGNQFVIWSLKGDNQCDEADCNSNKNLISCALHKINPIELSKFSVNLEFYLIINNRKFIVCMCSIKFETQLANTWL